MNLKSLIREVPDFPKPGINFYDITTLLKNPLGFKGVIDSLAAHYRSTPIDLVLGIEARGFIIAPAVASTIMITPGQAFPYAPPQWTGLILATPALVPITVIVLLLARDLLRQSFRGIRQVVVGG